MHLSTRRFVLMQAGEVLWHLGLHKRFLSAPWTFCLLPTRFDFNHLPVIVQKEDDHHSNESEDGWKRHQRMQVDAKCTAPGVGKLAIRGAAATSREDLNQKNDAMCRCHLLAPPADPEAGGVTSPVRD